MAKQKPTKIYLHATFGNYEQVPPNYHYCIRGDGTVVENAAPTTYLSDHTKRRNMGSIAIALCCMGNSVVDRFGTYLPTPVQIEKMASLIATLCNRFDIPLTSNHVMTHAEAARLDGYFPDKWDLWKLTETGEDWSGGVILREKARWYQDKIST